MECGKLPKCEVIWQNWLVYGVFFQKKKFPEIFSWNIEQKNLRPNICRNSPQITLTLTYIRFIKLLDEYFWTKKIDPPPPKKSETSVGIWCSSGPMKTLN